jgi:nitroreductase
MSIKCYLKKHAAFLASIPLFVEFYYDFVLYWRFSGIRNKNKSESQLLGKIIADYHVIEKGLTMPESRAGFGADKIIGLVDNCFSYMDSFGCDNEQVRYALSVLVEYDEFHKEANFKLDPKVQEKIELARTKKVESSNQISVLAKDYFPSDNCGFSEFSRSRRSVRHYSNKEVSLDVIKKAVAIAQNAPSSCNRQGTRVYVVSGKREIEKLLSIQRGNRGFGHLANKFIIVTGSLGYSFGRFERHLAYVDGGMYLMNLLYALHDRGVVACPLNSYFSHKDCAEFKTFFNIPDEEVLIGLISCGYATDSFKIAYSYRSSVDNIFNIR